MTFSKTVFNFITGMSMIFILYAACSKSFSMEKTQITLSRQKDDTKISLMVELAKTPEEQAQGFMERKKIPEGTGMLFVFPSDQILRFWMKNTPSPLSIAYIDSNGKIRDIFDLKPFSEASISSTTSVRYALEVPQGWFTKVGVSVGDSLILPLNKK